MSLEGRWTKFQIEAEVDHYDFDRLVPAHNALVDKLQAVEAELAELKKKHPYRRPNQTRDPRTLPMICELCTGEPCTDPRCPFGGEG